MNEVMNPDWPRPVHPAIQFEDSLNIWPSQIATIMGLNPWQTPLELWYQKTGRVEKPNFDDNESVEMGNRLEALIAEIFAERESVKVRRKTQTITHQRYPYWRGKIDREVLNQPVHSLLECKNTSEYQSGEWGPSGSDKYPDYYAVQVHSYFPCGTGFDAGFLAVLIGGRQHRRYRIERDPEIDEIIESNVLWFRDHLMNDTHPAPMNSSDLEKLFPDSLQDCVEATEDVMKDIMQLRVIQNSLKELTDAKKEISERLKMFIGPHAGLTDNEGKITNTWKTQKVNRFNQKGFRADHPETAENYMVAGSQRRFLIK